MFFNLYWQAQIIIWKFIENNFFCLLNPFTFFIHSPTPIPSDSCQSVLCIYRHRRQYGEHQSKEESGSEEGKVGIMGKERIEGDLTWGGERIIQHTDDVLQNCIPKTYLILLTNVTLINSIKKKILTVISEQQAHEQNISFILYSFLTDFLK